MEGSSKHSVTLDVMPLVCGFLPRPAVRLSRYIPAEQKPKGTKVIDYINMRNYNIRLL